jgi:hypothetical protein
MNKENEIILDESRILPGQFCSVKLQFKNQDSAMRTSDETEEFQRLFTYTYSKHGVVLAIRNDPNANEQLLFDTQNFIKNAWKSLKEVEVNWSLNDFIELEPELRTKRYNTYDNGYVRFEYGYSLLYAVAKDIEKLSHLMCDEEVIINSNKYEIINKTAIYNDVKDGKIEGIIFELKQIKS